MCLALRFGFGIGVVPINAFQVSLKLLPNFYGKSSTAFHLFLYQKSSSALPQMRHCMPNAILTKISNVRILQPGCPIFTMKIW